MSEDSHQEQIVALDYTPIVRHRGKQFTLGDISLAKVGGVDLHAAGISGAPAAVVFVAFFALFFLIGKSLFLAVLPAALVWVGFYIWFSREVIDTQPPLDRMLMAVSIRRNAPVRLSGTGQTVRTSNWMSELVGAKHHAADEYPTTLHWAAIVKRASDPDHASVQTSIPDRAQYRPKPIGLDLTVEDDQYTYEDWAEYLAGAR